MERRWIWLWTLAGILVAILENRPGQQALETAGGGRAGICLPLIHVNALSAERRNGTHDSGQLCCWGQSTGSPSPFKSGKKGGTTPAEATYHQGQDSLPVQCLFEGTQEVLCEGSIQVPIGYCQDRTSHCGSRTRTGEDLRHRAERHFGRFCRDTWRDSTQFFCREYVGPNACNMGAGGWCSTTRSSPAGTTCPGAASDDRPAAIAGCTATPCPLWSYECAYYYSTATSCDRGPDWNEPRSCATVVAFWGCGSANYSNNVDRWPSSCWTSWKRPWRARPVPFRPLRGGPIGRHSWRRYNAFYQHQPRSQSTQSTCHALSAEETAEDPHQATYGNLRTTEPEREAGKSTRGSGCARSYGGSRSISASRDSSPAWAQYAGYTDGTVWRSTTVFGRPWNNRRHEAFWSPDLLWTSDGGYRHSPLGWHRYTKHRDPRGYGRRDGRCCRRWPVSFCRIISPLRMPDYLWVCRLPRPDALVLQLGGVLEHRYHVGQCFPEECWACLKERDNRSHIVKRCPCTGFLLSPPTERSVARLGQFPQMPQPSTSLAGCTVPLSGWFFHWRDDGHPSSSTGKQGALWSLELSCSLPPSSFPQNAADSTEQWISEVLRRLALLSCTSPYRLGFWDGHCLVVLPRATFLARKHSDMRALAKQHEVTITCNLLNGDSFPGSRGNCQSKSFVFQWVSVRERARNMYIGRSGVQASPAAFTLPPGFHAGQTQCAVHYGCRSVGSLPFDTQRRRRCVQAEEPYRPFPSKGLGIPYPSLLGYLCQLDVYSQVISQPVGQSQQRVRAPKNRIGGSGAVASLAQGQRRPSVIAATSHLNGLRLLGPSAYRHPCELDVHLQVISQHNLPLFGIGPLDPQPRRPSHWLDVHACVTPQQDYCPHPGGRILFEIAWALGWLCEAYFRSLLLLVFIALLNAWHKPFPGRHSPLGKLFGSALRLAPTHCLTAFAIATPAAPVLAWRAYPKRRPYTKCRRPTPRFNRGYTLWVKILLAIFGLTSAPTCVWAVPADARPFLQHAWQGGNSAPQHVTTDLLPEALHVRGQEVQEGHTEPLPDTYDLQDRFRDDWLGVAIYAPYFPTTAFAMRVEPGASLEHVCRLIQTSGRLPCSLHDSLVAVNPQVFPGYLSVLSYPSIIAQGKRPHCAVIIDISRVGGTVYAATLPIDSRLADLWCEIGQYMNVDIESEDVLVWIGDASLPASHLGTISVSNGTLVTGGVGLAAVGLQTVTNGTLVTVCRPTAASPTPPVAFHATDLLGSKSKWDKVEHMPRPSAAHCLAVAYGPTVNPIVLAFFPRFFKQEIALRVSKLTAAQADVVIVDNDPPPPP